MLYFSINPTTIFSRMPSHRRDGRPVIGPLRAFIVHGPRNRRHPVHTSRTTRRIVPADGEGRVACSRCTLRSLCTHAAIVVCVGSRNAVQKRVCECTCVCMCVCVHVHSRARTQSSKRGANLGFRNLIAPALAPIPDKNDVHYHHNSTFSKLSFARGTRRLSQRSE